MTSLDLFAKTELWVEGLVLDEVDLTALAACAADVLGLAREEVFVTDVRAGHVIFDVTARAVRLEDIAGREADLLARLARSPGVTVTPGASIHSHGVLGVIGAPAEQAGQIVTAAAAMEANLRAYVSRSVAVLSTGGEVARGEIEDTNYAAIAELLGAAGYNTTHAGVAEDDEAVIAGRIAHLAEDGYGLIVTTGGVGAEDKDRTIDAVARLTPEIATAILATYESGHGRHVRPHVRVAAARLGDVLVVCLPGPTREVRAALPALVTGLATAVPLPALAEAVAEPIRALWRAHAHPQHESHLT